MNRESRQARKEREARRAALPVDPFRDFPKRSWTRQRILYTLLLWLMWVAVACAMLLMAWHANDRRFSVLLEPAPRMTGLTLMYWLGIALLVGIPLRLLFDNPRMSFFPILLGGWGALSLGFLSEDQLHGVDRNVIVHHVLTKRVVVRKLEQRSMGGRRGGSGPVTIYHVDNPMHAGQLIEFPQAVMWGSLGDVYCSDVVVGQLGGLWALPPRDCTKPAPRGRSQGR